MFTRMPHDFARRTTLAAAVLTALATAAGCSADDAQAVNDTVSPVAAPAQATNAAGRVSRQHAVLWKRGESATSLEASLSLDGTNAVDDVESLSFEDRSRPSFKIAPHPRFPLVVNQGGTVLTKPVFTSVTFDNPYTNKIRDLDTFVATIGNQPFWAATTKEYGVGEPKVRHPAHLNEAAPTAIDDSAIQAWLAAKLTSCDPRFGAPSSDSLFVLYYPSTTKVTISSGGAVVASSCDVFSGYHSFVPVTVDGKPIVVPYAVIPECLPEGDAGASETLDSVTEAVSHELVEAATDPFVNAEGRPGLPSGIKTAFSGTALHTADFDPYAVWAYNDSGSLNFPELSDMCESFGSSNFTPAHFPFEVQRSWSNKAVRGSHDPCAPNRTGERFFFAAVPVFDPDFAVNEAKDPPVYLPAVHITETTAPTPSTFQTQGLKIPVGQSATLPVNLFSDGPVSDWTVTAADATFNTPATPNLTFTWDKTKGNNGDVLHLTIHVVAVDPAIRGNAFRITSTDGVIKHSFFGYIGQD